MIKLNYQKILNESKARNKNLNFLETCIGNIIKLKITTFEKNKKRTQIYEGIIIKKKVSSHRIDLIVRKSVQGIGVEKKFVNLLPNVEIIHLAKPMKSK